MNLQDQGEPVNRARRTAPAEGTPIMKDSGDDLTNFEFFQTPEDAITKAEGAVRVTEAEISGAQAGVEAYAAASGEEQSPEARAPFAGLIHRAREIFGRLRDKLGAPAATEERAPETGEQEPASDVEQEFLSVAQECARAHDDRERTIVELIASGDASGLHKLLERTMAEFEAALRAQAGEARTFVERADFWKRKLNQTPPERPDPASIELLKRSLQRIGHAIVSIEHPELTAKPLPVNENPAAEAVPNVILDEELTKKISSRFPQQLELDREEAVPGAPQDKNPTKKISSRFPKQLELAEWEENTPLAIAATEYAEAIAVKVESVPHAAPEIPLSPTLEALRKETLLAVEARLRELDALAAKTETRAAHGISMRAIEIESALLLDHKAKLDHGELPLDAVRLRIQALEDELRTLKTARAAGPAAAAPRAAEAAADADRTELFAYLDEPYELTELEIAAIPQALESATGKTTAQDQELATLANNLAVVAMEIEAIPSLEPHPALEAPDTERFAESMHRALVASRTERPTLKVPIFDFDRERAELTYQAARAKHIEIVAEWSYLKRFPLKGMSKVSSFLRLEDYITQKRPDAFWTKHRSRITEAEREDIGRAIWERFITLQIARGEIDTSESKGKTQRIRRPETPANDKAAE